MSFAELKRPFFLPVIAKIRMLWRILHFKLSGLKSNSAMIANQFVV